MKIREVSTVPADTLEALLSAIPFYKVIKKQNVQQFNVLMSFSRIINFTSGEKIISKGALDTWSYFIVKGQLIVSLPSDNGKGHHVNYITPGEVLGDLSVYLQTPRTADVHVDENCREAILFGTDFGLFGDLTNYNRVSLATKLEYYRHATHSVRWKLEMYRSKYRSHPLAEQHRRVTLYVGVKDGEKELRALFTQVVELSKLLLKWNESFGSLHFADGTIPSPHLNL
jgi:hypothetical protein